MGYAGNRRGVMGGRSLKLLDQVRARLRVTHYNLRTKQAYLGCKGGGCKNGSGVLVTHCRGRACLELNPTPFLQCLCNIPRRPHTLDSRFPRSSKPSPSMDSPRVRGNDEKCGFPTTVSAIGPRPTLRES
jgi:hypothetical protein